MNNARALLTFKEYRCQQTYNVITFDERTSLIEQKAAIVIAVPCNAEISLVFLDGIYSRCTIFFQHRVRYAVRESAIRIVIDLDEFERQVFFKAINHRTRTTITSVHHHLEFLQL